MITLLQHTLSINFCS